MIKFKQKGDFSKLTKFLEDNQTVLCDVISRLDKEMI